MKRKTFSVEVKKEAYGFESGKHQINLSTNGFQTLIVSDLYIEELEEIEKTIRKYIKDLKKIDKSSGEEE